MGVVPIVNENDTLAVSVGDVAMNVGVDGGGVITTNAYL